MQWLATALALLALVTGSSADLSSRPEHGGPLDADQRAAATAAAATVLTDDDVVTSATYTIRDGHVLGGNTGHPCTSGRIVTIQLIGSFPQIGTTGHPVPPGRPAPDFTVGAVQLDADLGSGHPCLVGVQTLENGPIEPRGGSWTLYEP